MPIFLLPPYFHVKQCRTCKTKFCKAVPRPPLSVMLQAYAELRANTIYVDEQRIANQSAIKRQPG
jgi:hypothetical protein